MTDVHSSPTSRVGQPRGEILFVKQGNLLYVAGPGFTPTPTDVFGVLHPHLSFEQKEFLYGARARDPNTGRKRRVEITEKRLYGVDAGGRLYTAAGFLSRCHRELTGAGYVASYAETADPPGRRSDRYTPNWANVERCFQYRPRQKECLEAVAKSRHGVVHAITGFGKMAAVAMICLLYPRAKIDVVTKRLPLVNKTVDYLTKYLPNVGMYGDGRKVKGDRITVYSCGSLGYSDFDADILLVDEGHEAVTDVTSEMLARYQNSRNFSLTASPEGRSDGSDPRLEALFGPTIFYIPYWEGVELGLVVPIRVEWLDVLLARNPAAGLEDVERKRWGIWFNKDRNDIIADDMLRVSQSEQLLGLTGTVMHAVELFRRIREQRDRRVVLVYDQIDVKRFEKYKAQQLIPEDTPKMTPELKEQYRKQFEAGEIDAVATTTWEVGIDPIHLQHLFVCDSFSSEIKAQQAPGRASRINQAGKEVGIVHDCRDQFDESFCRAAKTRFGVYASMRWEQVLRTGSGYTPL